MMLRLLISSALTLALTACGGSADNSRVADGSQDSLGAGVDDDNASVEGPSPGDSTVVTPPTIEPDPIDPLPVEPPPVEPDPVEPPPVEPDPVEPPPPVEPDPVEPPPPVEPDPVEPPPPVEPDPVEPDPVEPPSDGFIDFAWDGRHPDAVDWNGYAKEALVSHGSQLLSGGANDMADFCPNYSNLNGLGKQMFWISLVAAMVKHESDFDPASYRVVSTAGGNIVKRGLMRIDIGLADASSCGIVDPADLQNPRINLECSIKILNYWVNQDNYIFRNNGGSNYAGGSRIWTSLQNTATRQNIQSITRSSDVCK